MREGKRVKNKVKSKEEVEVKKRKERGLEGKTRRVDGGREVERWGYISIIYDSETNNCTFANIKKPTLKL